MKTLDYWDNTGISSDDFLRSLGNHMILGACDPAISLTPRSDYSAIVTGALDITGKVLYVIDAEAGRWGFDDLVKRISLRHEIRKYVRFIYEANAAQAWLGVRSRNGVLFYRLTHLPILSIRMFVSCV